MPTRLTLAKENRTVHLEGGLGMGASAAEIFLLEYAQWPRDAGWGRWTGPDSKRCCPCTAGFSTPSTACLPWRQAGSELLLNIANALAGQEAPECVEKARLVIYVGHDTNIAAVSGLLDSHSWHLPGYAPDEIPPGSALALSLWEKPDGEYDVRAQFFAQSLETLHDPNGRGDIWCGRTCKCRGAPLTAPAR
ncbi:MAG: histidine-type phosphatase [Bilophila sp.]